MMRLAKIVSYIIHPVLMPLLGVIIIFNSGTYISELPPDYKRFVYTLVALCTIVLPLTLMPALYFLKNIQSFTLDERRERIFPLLFTAICFYIAYHIISKISPVRILNFYLLACVVAVAIVFLVSVFWKLSIHMTGMGGICALIVVLSLIFSLDMTIYLAAAILVTGIVASSRLLLKAHVPEQIAIGFAVGFLSVGVIMYLVLK